MTAPTQTDIDKSDASGLAISATADELERLKLAEEVLALARDRKRNTSRWALISQALVSVLAVSGMLINAYQGASARAQQAVQRQADQDRWNKEFQRAMRADKYRAFFETSVLATDPANPDKRLVGYALLQEFVDDEDYNSKATLMLEESLAQELRGDVRNGLDEAHRNAVLAIVNALSESTDCHALERASRSIDRVARRHATAADTAETTEIFGIYVRRLLGRASIVCRTMKDLDSVRRPLVDTLMKFPEIGGMSGKPTLVEANTHLASLLVEACRDELALTGGNECANLVAKYIELCNQPVTLASKDDQPACAAMKAAAPSLTPPPVVAPAPAPEP